MERINVTKTFLPPKEEYLSYVDQIWKSSYLTNQGPLLKEFEEKTKEYLNVDNFHFVSNGTIALQIALRALGITDGEIITTPFSYVATTSSILWEKCSPIFVDIEPDTFCIDVDKIEAAISDKTRAIMAVHVFGYPCDVEKIDAIAKKHNLKVIYDGAHAFGAQYNGKSLLSYGDITTCSFHATKLFHTIEGGALIVKDKKVSDNVELLKRFGHEGDNHTQLGINAKASEFQAAMGLCNLNYLDEILEKRQQVSDLYNEFLGKENQVTKKYPTLKWNYGYYPLVIESEEKLLRCVEELNKQNVYPRRYFYPSLNQLSYLDKEQSCPISENIAKRILCLPLYPSIATADIQRICKSIMELDNE